MEIILDEQSYLLPEYRFNFEELKIELNLNLEKYRNLVVTEEAVKEAKTTRADLNKLKKNITDKVIEIKKTHLKPFDAFKIQTDQLIRLIDEPVEAIDSQIKTYEQKVKDEKLAEIIALWEKEKPTCVELNFIEQVFKNEWLNVAFSMSKIKAAMIDLTIKIASDLQIIESFNSEFEVPIKETYFKNFDMSAAMREKAKYEQRKLEEAERQAILKAELERKETLRRAEEERRQAEEVAKIDITSPPNEEKKFDITKPVINDKENEIQKLKQDIQTLEKYRCDFQEKINQINREIHQKKVRIQELNKADELIGEIEVPF